MAFDTIDASRNMIDQAHRKHTGANLEFRLKDINNMDFEDEFDVAFSNATLHWIKDHECLLAAIRRALRAGGILRFNFAGQAAIPGYRSEPYAPMHQASRRDLPESFDVRSGQGERIDRMADDFPEPIRVRVRKATEHDLPQMVELWKELIESHRRLDPLFKPRQGASEAWLKFVSENMAKDTALVLVAEQDGRIVGHSQAFIIAYPPVFEMTHYGELMEMVVHPAHRRQGVGDQLFAETKRWYKDRGITRIEVRALAFNPVSTSFWRKMGFRPYLETLAFELL